jgi:transposase-like protein
VSGASAGSVIPLPAGTVREGRTEGVPALVAAFLGATSGLPVEEAARLASVRPETIRKWRRRLPRWLKADTARRIAAHLAGEEPRPAPIEEGFRRAFHLRLREAPPE